MNGQRLDFVPKGEVSANWQGAYSSPCPFAVTPDDLPSVYSIVEWNLGEVRVDLLILVAMFLSVICHWDRKSIKYNTMVKVENLS